MRWRDEHVEAVIGGLLRAGVTIAAVAVAAGGVLYLARYGADPAAYGVFKGEPSDLRSVRGILAGTASFHLRSVIQLGLLLLIATPVARVAFSIVAFAVQRDRAYVAITTTVLAILIYSLAGGAPGGR